MIKVTEEMQLAFIEAKQASDWGPNTAYVDGLAAVLAIVERDYRVEPRPPWERAPHCPVVNDRCPGNADGWICDHPCNPDGTT